MLDLFRREWCKFQLCRRPAADSFVVFIQALSCGSRLPLTFHEEWKHFGSLEPSKLCELLHVNVVGSSRRSCVHERLSPPSPPLPLPLPDSAPLPLRSKFKNVGYVVRSLKPIDTQFLLSC